jgi:CheY-like chemotaxis protein
MRTVLLVDDEFAIVDVLAVLLEDEGFRVVTAANGLEALARAAESPPDVIVLDVMMPVMDGIAFLAALDQTVQRDVPVVVVSATYPARLITGPRRVFLAKPFLFDKLIATIRKLLGG